MLSNYEFTSPDTIPIIILTITIELALSNDTTTEAPTLPGEMDPEHHNFNFRGYLSKYSPSKVWEEIDKKRKFEGAQISDEEQLDIMFNALDQTDDVYNLRIGTSIPKNEFPSDGRRYINWQPPQRIKGWRFDQHYNRNRLYDLMRQAIYQARNRMIVMQITRQKYRRSSVYKMGFLTNKADIAVKSFCKVSFSSLRTCVASRTASVVRAPASELVEYNHRQLLLWLDVQILAQLIERNYDITVRILRNRSIPKKATLNKLFIP